MANVKTSVTLPDEIVEQLDKLAKDRRLSRSDLLTLALEEYLSTPENRSALQHIEHTGAGEHPLRRFPAYENQVRRLVERHLELRDEPLLLAIYYAPERNPDDIFLFEVSENFGAGLVDPDKELFEATYASSKGFPIAAGQRLHLILTKPHELREALVANWSKAVEIRQAVQQNQAHILWSEPDTGDNLLRLLNA